MPTPVNIPVVSMVSLKAAISPNAADLGMTAADITNKQKSSLLGGAIFLVAQNVHATLSYTVSVTSQADPVFGRKGDIPPYSIDAGEIALLGPFSPNGWADANGDLLYEASNANIKFAAVKVPS